MLLLKSLFCFTGLDNRRRYIVIHTSSYFLFALISSILSSSILLSFITLCFFVSLSTFSTKRRLKDANLNKSWLYPPAISFIIAGLIIMFTGHSTSYWLLLFPLAVSTLLMTYKSQNYNNYILGYCGDIDLSDYIKEENHQIRIEPTFNQGDINNSQENAYRDEDSVFSQNINSPKMATSQSANDIGEAIRLKLFNHKNAFLTIVILILLVFMAMVLTSVISTSSEDNNIITDDNEIEKVQLQQDRLHNVSFPDDFSLFVSPFDSITIKWQGDSTSKVFLWQQLTAQGDKSCKAINFNDGKMIRTLKVVQENSSDYLASFSPLDTKTIIKNIAIRGSFSLCGYKFSLKGSQSVLGKHSYYSTFIAN